MLKIRTKTNGTPFGIARDTIRAAKREAESKAAKIASADLAREAARGTGLPASTVDAAIRTADTARNGSRIVSSAEALLAKAYRFKIQLADASGNRARVRVPWFGGSRQVAGFVNPRSKKKLPLSTKGKKGRLINARAPSVARAVRTALTDRKREEYSALLSDEFLKRITRR